MFDVIIRNGHLIDGTGNPFFRTDLGIKAGKIAAIRDLSTSSANTVIDAKKQVVCPGFIDVHSHSDISLLVNPRAESVVRQGITTSVIGMCGNSAAPLNEEMKDLFVEYVVMGSHIPLTWRTFAEFLQEYETRGVAINVAGFIGHGTVRLAVKGYTPGPPTPAELDEMRVLVKQSMEDGAFGLSSGLAFTPGAYAQMDEVVELCKVVAQYGGSYSSHIRSQDTYVVEATQETIATAEKAEIPAQLSHHQACFPYFEKGPGLLCMLDEARARGIDVTNDLHPYETGITGLTQLMPAWILEGGFKALSKRLSNIETRKKIIADIKDPKEPIDPLVQFMIHEKWDEFILIQCTRHPEFIGQSVEEIAATAQKVPFDALFDLMLAEGEDVYAMMMTAPCYGTDEIRRVMKYPRSMIMTDSFALAPYGELGQLKMHPRCYGAFPLVFRKYVREEQLIPLEEAIRKVTSFPAQRIGLTSRGVIRPGMWADVVVFDPQTIRDTATLAEPDQYPEGIEYVLVNGQLVITQGTHTDNLPGHVLRHQKNDSDDTS